MNHTANLSITIIMTTMLASCSVFGSGDEDADRCEKAARKVSKTYGGDENMQAESYRGTLTKCTPRPEETLTTAGSDYLDCVIDAAHGAAILRCQYEFEVQAEQEAIDDLAEAAKPVWADMCGGKDVDPSNDSRMDEVNELESRARSFGADDDDIQEAIKRSAKSAGCSDEFVAGLD